MVRSHLERKRLDKNKDAWSKNNAKVGGPANKAAPANKDHAAGDRAPSNGPKQGDCRQWLKEDKCSRGSNCSLQNPQHRPRQELEERAQIRKVKEMVKEQGALIEKEKEEVKDLLKGFQHLKNNKMQTNKKKTHTDNTY